MSATGEFPPNCTQCRALMLVCSSFTNPAHVGHDAEDPHYICPNCPGMMTGTGMKAIDPDQPCPHANFQAHVDVNRLTSEEGGPITAYSADIRVACSSCGERFRWMGVQAGHRPDRPMVSVDEFELHAPIRPASSDPDFGLGIPGFSIGYREEPA